jgi:hypothetical protein
VRGHVRRRGKRWSYVIEVGRDERGRRRQKWTGGFRTRREAEAGLADALGRLQSGIYVPPTKQTVGEYLREWLRGMRASVRASTWASYRTNIERHVVPLIGSVRLRELRAVHLNDMYARLLKSGRKDGKGLSPRTVRYIHAILRRDLKDALREGLLLQNPVELARPPKQTRQEMKTWSSEELRAFLEYAQRAASTRLISSPAPRGSAEAR